MAHKKAKPCIDFLFANDFVEQTFWFNKITLLRVQRINFYGHRFVWYVAMKLKGIIEGLVFYFLLLKFI